MEMETFAEPRRFPVGLRSIRLNHVANVSLQADEMITFISGGGRQYDVTAKDWGYYATPSVGNRLRLFGMRAALMRNVHTRQTFVVLVFDDCVPVWEEYMRNEHQELVLWLDEIDAPLPPPPGNNG